MEMYNIYTSSVCVCIFDRRAFAVAVVDGLGLTASAPAPALP